MAARQDKWPVLLGWINVGLGIALVLAYWIYLPAPARFMAAGNPDPGLILYALATAGSAFVAWGLMLRGVSASGISRGLVFKSAAAGFALLGFMRLGTALFPHAPFDQMLALPVIECVVFAVVAVLFFRAS